MSVTPESVCEQVSFTEISLKRLELDTLEPTVGDQKTEQSRTNLAMSVLLLEEELIHFNNTAVNHVSSEQQHTGKWFGMKSHGLRREVFCHTFSAPHV